MRLVIDRGLFSPEGEVSLSEDFKDLSSDEFKEIHKVLEEQEEYNKIRNMYEAAQAILKDFPDIGFCNMIIYIGDEPKVHMSQIEDMVYDGDELMLCEEFVGHAFRKDSYTLTDY